MANAGWRMGKGKRGKTKEEKSSFGVVLNRLISLAIVYERKLHSYEEKNLEQNCSTVFYQLLQTN